MLTENLWNGGFRGELLAVNPNRETIDGIPVQLFANIELPNDVPVALDAGAEGIGLFRTEFLFLDRGDMPDEREQYEAY